jgi:hypothetical protein
MGTDVSHCTRAAACTTCAPRRLGVFLTYYFDNIGLFHHIPPVRWLLESIDRLSLGTKLRDIGRSEGATSGQEKAS